MNASRTWLLGLALAMACDSSSDEPVGDGGGQIVRAADASAQDAAAGDSAGNDDDASAPGECQQLERALVEMFEEHRTCTTDADCQFVYAHCLPQARVDCTGAFYVNTQLDEAEWMNVEARHQSCAPMLDCATCLMGPATAVCASGSCAPEWAR